MRRLTVLAAVMAACLLTGAAWAQETSPKPDLTKGHTLYCVGYAHLDTEWRWAYPQVIREFIPNTMLDNFKLFQKYPDYIFNFTGIDRYRYMQEYYPADFAKVKQYVASGQWFPAGSSVEENDVNNPSAESLLRQVLYGNEYFRKEFGKASEEFMLPDCFGFPESLPEILAHCGIKGFSTQKLTWGSAVGIPFNVGVWKGPDGSGVVAALNPGSYTSSINDDLSHDQGWLNRIDEDGKKSGVYVDYMYYGTGDRGGAPSDSSVNWLEKSLHGGGPVKVISCDADQMFKDLTPEEIAKLPTYQGDLLLTQHSAGSITSQAYMKRWNHKNEMLADAAERASVGAAWLGAATYPLQRLNKAWELVLGGQFHDLLAGTCLPVAYDFSWNDEVLAMNQFAGVLQNATGGVASAMDTRSRGVSLVVYNPLSIGRQDVVRATVALPASTRAVRVVGPDGAVAPSQVLGPDGKGIKILFVATVPAVGFASFDVQASRAPEPADSALKVTENSIENARYRVTLDQNGDIASIFDKAANRQMLTAPARLAFQYENPSQYPSWNMDWDDQSKPPRAYVTRPATFRIVENGPVQVALKISRKSQGSVFVQTIRLSAGDAGNRIEIANHIDWHTGETALKAVFPLSVSNPMATYNWEVGAIQRGNNDPKKYEVPSHQWFDLTDTSGKYGVTVLSDCKNGSDKPDDNTLRLTLLYSPGTRAGYQDQAEQDWGQHDFVYGLAGHTGDWRQGRTNWEALRLSQPLIAFQSPSHPGGLGKTFSLVSLNNPAVRILALKKAEDSDEIIVRLVELDGKPATNVHVHFAVPVAAAREVNGQEQPAGPATVTGGDLVTDLTAYQLRTFAVRLSAPPVTVPAAHTQTVTLPYNLCATSSDGQKSNGGFDVGGQAIPAAMLPQTISYGDVPFEFGPITGGKPNAVICQGQKIELPAGKFTHLYILAASADKDRPATFKVDGRSTTVNIQQWGGYIGQWDQRYFLGKIPELSYDWPNKFGGLLPGYIKRQPVAWFSPFRHTAAGQDEPYSYAYLFAYEIPVRAGARTLTLPDAPDVRVMAATMADDPEGELDAAAPLYDVIDRKTGMAPDISPAAGAYNDTTTVTFQQELYGTSDSYHYTTDGSIPTAASSSYTGPLTLTRNTDLKARMITPTGITGPVVVADYRIHDTTPPHILAATASTLTPDARVTFSEPVDPATAGNSANYLMNGGPAVKAASLMPDGRTVLLTLAGLPAPMAKMSVQVAGIKDVSPAGNMIRQAITQDVTMEGPVAQLAEATLDGKGGGSKSVQIDNQAVASGSSDWTINFWLWVDAEPAPYTLIAGFGSGQDASGQQRYLSVFPNGLHFWGGNIDIDAGGRLDTGTWEMLSATYDGANVHIYKNGKEVGSGAASFSDAQPVMKVAPRAPWPDHGGRLDGKIRDLTIWDRTLAPASLAFLATQAPN